MSTVTTSLALRSLRGRRTAFAATGLSVLLGTLLIGSFATLAETATGPVSDADAETLTIMGAVVGGWGALIVLFSVASTVGLTVGQRATEIGLLRTVGATPRQARRLVRAEVLVVVATMASVGAALAAVGGRLLLAMLRGGGLVADDVAFGGGAASLVGAGVLVVAVSWIAASVAARRATRGPATLAVAASAERQRIRWWRVAAGLVLLAYGVGTVLVTLLVTADDPDPYAAMQTSGSSAILVGVGLATLAPLLLRWTAPLARPFVGRSGARHLAVVHAARRAHLLSSVMAPVVVLTSSAIGTLMLVGIDGRTLSGPSTSESDTITLLNNVVVGMIVVFAAVMVVNASAAVMAARREEVRRLGLVGASPDQVRATIGTEALVVAVVGVVLGAIASLATVVPFAVARHEGVVPDGQLWLPFAVGVGVVALTVVSARAALRRTAPAVASLSR